MSDDIWKSYINESVTLYVKDHKYDDYPDDVLGVIHHLWSKINMSRWWKEGGRDWIDSDTIAPDGMDALEPKGTINFYAGLTKLGDSPELAEAFLGELRQWIEGLDIPTQVRGPERSNSFRGAPLVYRIDIDIPEKNIEDPPLLQMSNSNAHEVFENVLDIYDPGNIDARDLLIRIDSYINDIDIRAGVREPRDERTEAGARVIDQGIDEDYIKTRLDQIRSIAEWAIENGYNTLYAI